MKGEPATRRGAMTRKRRAEVFLQAGGRCQGEGCGVKLLGAWVADHIIPLDLTGPDTLANLQALCVPCDKAKYPGDAGNIAKARRLRAKNDPERERKPSKLQGRGFEGWRNFKGEIVRRER